MDLNLENLRDYISNKNNILKHTTFRFYSNKNSDYLALNLIEQYAKLNEITLNQSLKTLLAILMTENPYYFDLANTPSYSNENALQST